MKYITSLLYSIYPIWIGIGVFLFSDYYYQNEVFDNGLLLILILLTSPLTIPSLILYFALISKDNSYKKILVENGKVKTVVDKELNQLEVIEVTKIERHPKYDRFITIEPWSIFKCIEIKTNNGTFYISSMSNMFKNITFFNEVKNKKYPFPGEINI